MDIGNKGWIGDRGESAGTTTTLFRHRNSRVAHPSVHVARQPPLTGIDTFKTQTRFLHPRIRIYLCRRAGSPRPQGKNLFYQSGQGCPRSQWLVSVCDQYNPGCGFLFASKLRLFGKLRERTCGRRLRIFSAMTRIARDAGDEGLMRTSGRFADNA